MRQNQTKIKAKTTFRPLTETCLCHARIQPTQRLEIFAHFFRRQLFARFRPGNTAKLYLNTFNSFCIQFAAPGLPRDLQGLGIRMIVDGQEAGENR